MGGVRRFTCQLCSRALSSMRWELDESWNPADGWQATREWVETLTDAPWAGSNAELVIKVRRLRHQAGQLSTSDMLGDQEDVFVDPEMHWLRERCANTKACAHRLRSAASRAHVRKEVLMERTWHRHSARHMRYLPQARRVDASRRVFVELPPATAHGSIEEAQEALRAGQEESGAAYLKMRGATKALLARFEGQAAKPPPPKRHAKVEHARADQRPQEHLVRLFESQLVRLEILRDAFSAYCAATSAALGIEQFELLSLEGTAAHMAMCAIRTPRTSAVPE